MGKEIQQIYLSRHGEATHNRYKCKQGLKNSDSFSLTPHGEYEARILGKYFVKNKIYSPIWLTSNSKRSIDTARLTIKEMGEGDNHNFYKRKNLCETQTKEQKIKERGYKEGDLNYQKILDNQEFISQKDLAEIVKNEIMNIGKLNSSKLLVVIGHIGTNEALLKSIGVNLSRSAMGNCGLFEIERRENILIPRYYLSNKQIEKSL